MPEEVRDRFKALKVLYDQVNELDEEEEKEYRQLELKYEKMYAEIYAKRALLVKGLEEPSQNLIDQFEEVKKGLADQKYSELEVPICDVKDIQNTEKECQASGRGPCWAISPSQRPLSKKTDPS